jgi:hypothetical protein
VKYLFIMGCPRSGTTQLTELLDLDERLIVGMERFKLIKKELTPAHFEGEAFFEPTARETNLMRPALYARLRQRLRRGGVEYIGDKTPMYYQTLPELSAAFPEARFIFMLRDLEGVANSYVRLARDPKDPWNPEADHRRAVADWCESLECLKRHVKSGAGPEVFVVHFDRFYSGDESSYEELYRYLELEVTDAVRARYRVRRVHWRRRRRPERLLSEAMVAELNAARRTDLEEWLLKRWPKTSETADV